MAARALGTGAGALETVEVAIRTAMTALGAWLLSQLLSQLLSVDTGQRGPRIACGGGHQAEFVAYRAKRIDTVLGPVSLRRAYYHCAPCGHGVVPADTELGVAGGSLSPGLRKMIARAAATAPFAQADALLTELAGISLGAKRIERAAEADGQAAATAIQAATEAILARRVIPLPPAHRPDKLYIAIDGTGVPMVPAALTGHPGKGPDGRARTREVKLAALFTQTTCDGDGRPVRDPASTSYLGSFATAAEFGPLVDAEARRRGADHLRQLVVLGDGAPWIWTIAAAHFPAATEIVDLYHAREHVHALADAVAFILTDPPAWLAERLAELDAGNIPALLAAARALPMVGVKATERDKALRYFVTNAHRMRYAHYRDLGMFVGSGAVEAGCKAVIGQRLELSGMRWSMPGATGILTLRCQQASDRWDEIWTQPDNQIRPAALANNRI